MAAAGVMTKMGSLKRSEVSRWIVPIDLPMLFTRPNRAAFDCRNRKVGGAGRSTESI